MYDNRHIWTEIHQGFFGDLDNIGLQASNYHNLTSALEKVWNTGLADSRPSGGSGVPFATPVVLGRSPISSSPTSSAVVQLMPLTESSTLLSNTENSNTTTTFLYTNNISRKSLLSNDMIINDTLVSTTSSDAAFRTVTSNAAALEALTMPRKIETIKETNNNFQVQKFNRFTVVNGSSIDINFGIKTMDMKAISLSEQLLKPSNLTPSTTTPSTSISASFFSNALPSGGYYMGLSAERAQRVTSVFASPRDCHWIVVTSDPEITTPGVYEPMSLTMPLPIPFKTPR